MRYFLAPLTIFVSLLSLGHCAPRIVNSGPEPMSNSIQQEDPYRADSAILHDIDAGLGLAGLLPSELLHRQLKEAVIVISQTTQTKSPLLRSAVHQAVKNVKVKLRLQQPPAPTIKLQAFLHSLKQVITGPKFAFPPQFVQWITRHIDVIQTALVKNASGLSRIAEESENPWNPKVVSAFLKAKTDELAGFLVRGLRLLEQRPELGHVPQFHLLKLAVEDGKYDSFIAAIVWDMVAEDYDDDASVDFVTCVEELRQRASPDLQALPTEALNAIVNLSRSLTVEQVQALEDKLGHWTPTLTPDSR